MCASHSVCLYSPVFAYLSEYFCFLMKVNGTAPMPTTAPATTLTEKEKAPKPEPPTPIIEEAEESKPPPPKPVPPSTVTPTPRIQDLAETKRLQKEADKENERLVEYNFSNRLSRTDKIQKDIKQKDELKNDENLLKDERKKEDRLGETEVGAAPKADWWIAPGIWLVLSIPCVCVCVCVCVYVVQ